MASISQEQIDKAKEIAEMLKDIWKNASTLKETKLYIKEHYPQYCSFYHYKIDSFIKIDTVKNSDIVKKLSYGDVSVYNTFSPFYDYKKEKEQGLNSHQFGYTHYVAEIYGDKVDVKCSVEDLDNINVEIEKRHEDLKSKIKDSLFFDGNLGFQRKKPYFDFDTFLEKYEIESNKNGFFSLYEIEHSEGSEGVRLHFEKGEPLFDYHCYDYSDDMEYDGAVYTDDPYEIDIKYVELDEADVKTLFDKIKAKFPDTYEEMEEKANASLNEKELDEEEIDR